MKYFLLILLLSVRFHCLCNPLSDSACIYGKMSFLSDKDSVEIAVFPEGISFGNIESRIFFVTSSNGAFSLHLPVEKKYVCVNILFPKYPERNLGIYYVSAGDSVSMNENNGTILFKGRGSDRFYLPYRIKELTQSIAGRFVLTNENVDTWFSLQDSIRGASLNEVDKFFGKEKSEERELLTANFVMMAEIRKVSFLNRVLNSSNPYYSAVEKFYNSYLSTNKEWYRDFYANRKLYSQSQFYCKYLIEQYKLDSCSLKHRDFKVTSCFDFVASNYNGDIKEKLTALLISTYESQISSNDLTYLVPRVSPILVNPIFREYFETNAKSKLKGTVLYNFTLTDEFGKIRSLSDFKGAVLLMDFYFTGCGPCRKIHPLLDSIRALFPRDEFKLLSVSVDINRKEWIKTINSGLYTSRENINLYTSGNGEQDTLIKHFYINSFPTLLLVDKFGKLIGRPEDPRSDEGKELIRMIKSAILAHG